MIYTQKRPHSVNHFRNLRVLVVVASVFISLTALVCDICIISHWNEVDEKEERAISNYLQNVLNRLYRSVSKEGELIDFLFNNTKVSGVYLAQMKNFLKYGQFVFVSNAGEILYEDQVETNRLNRISATSNFVAKNIATERQLAYHHIKINKNKFGDFGHVFYTIPISPLVEKIHTVLSDINSNHTFCLLDKYYNEIYNSNPGAEVGRSKSCRKVHSYFSDDFYLCSTPKRTTHNLLVAINGVFVVFMCVITCLMYFAIDRAESGFKNVAKNCKNSTKDPVRSLQNKKLGSENPTRFSNFVHELRTPLSIIVAFSEIMKNEELGPMKNGEYLDQSKEIYNFSTALLSKIDKSMITKKPDF